MIRTNSVLLVLLLLIPPAAPLGVEPQKAAGTAVHVAIVLGDAPAGTDEPTTAQTARCLKAYELFRNGTVNKLPVTGGNYPRSFAFDPTGRLLCRCNQRAANVSLDAGETEPADREVEGVVEMMLDATQHLTAPLTDERLFAWHAALLSTGRSGMRKIIVGAWRDDARGPMQVVSGPVGREKVHYEAPAAPRLPDEVVRLLVWANEADRADAVMRAGIAHLWFVTIHPFDDGNGRTARAIADWQLGIEATLAAVCRRPLAGLSPLCARLTPPRVRRGSGGWSRPAASSSSTR